MANIGALKDGTPYAPKLLENKLKFLPYIKEAVAFGDGRDMVCALIDIDMAAAGRWADKRSISYTGHADLASRDEVYALIADCIANGQRASWRRSRRWRNRRSTALSSCTRSSAPMTACSRAPASCAVASSPSDTALWSTRCMTAEREVRVDVEGGEAATELKIRDAKVVASGQIGRAA